MTPLRSVEDPRVPYRVLTVILLGSALAAVVLAVLPSTDASLRGVDAIAAVLLAGAAAALWFLGERLPDGLSLDIAVLLAIVAATAATLTVSTAVGQVLVGLVLILLGVFLGYFRPPRRIAVLLGVMFGGYLGATLVNRLLDAWVDFVLVCLVILAVTVMVSRLTRELRALGLRDGLTGALNRRGLDLVAGPLAAAANRAGQPITVGLIDVNDFKVFNDTHGHVAGDAALVALVDAWRTQLRSADVLARYGGDEFALVLPNTRREDAEQLAARLAPLSDLRWTVGFVEWTPQEELTAALRRADELMYSRKPKRR